MTNTVVTKAVQITVNGFSTTYSAELIEEVKDLARRYRDEDRRKVSLKWVDSDGVLPPIADQREELHERTCS